MSRSFTALPDGGQQFETDDRRDWVKTVRATLAAGGTFDVLTGETRGTLVGVIHGVDAPAEPTPKPVEDLLGDVVPEKAKKEKS
jgi:hypothetical protein